MKKFLLSFLCLMTLFAVKAEEKTITFSSLGYTNAAAVTTVNDEPIALTFAAGSNTNAPKYYTTGTAIRFYGGNTLTISVPEGYKLNLVTFTISGSNTFNSGTTASVGTFANNVWTAPSEDTNKFVLTNGGTSGHARIQSIKFDYSIAGPVDNRKDAGLKFPVEELNVDLGSEFSSPVATAFDGAEITYSIDKESVATIDAQTGELTLVGAGSATVTAISAETDEYKEGKAEYILNVKDPNALEVTFDFVNNTYGMTRYTSGSTYNPKPTTITEGIVSIVLNNGNNRLWSDGLRCYNGTTATISVAAGYAITDVTFTSTGDSSFSSEKNDDNFVISYTPTSSNKAIKTITVKYANAAPATQVATPAFNPGAGAVAAGSKVEITCTTEGAAIYYTVNGDEPTTESAVYTEPIEINEDMTIKAIAVKEGLDDSKVAEAAYTLLPHVNSIADIESNIGYPAIGASSSEFTVNCDLTVNFASGAYIYVTDGTNCSLIFAFDTTVAAGDVIGKGWNATIKNYNGLYEFIPANNADIKANGEVGTVTEPIDLTADNADEVLTVANQCKPVRTHLYIFDAAVSGSLTAYLDEDKTVSVICRNPMNVAGFDDLVDKNGEINGYLSVYTTASRAGESGVQLNISRIGEMTGVEGVEVDSEDAAVEYFNLQGVRVENPAAGGLYIRKQGSKVTKVIL